MNQEIKKGFEWYRSLTKKQQKQWRKERLKLSKRSMETFYYMLNNTFTFSSFISGSFALSSTPQGHNYWKNIVNKNK